MGAQNFNFVPKFSQNWGISKGRREPQWGAGKHSRGAPGEKFLEFFFFRMAHSCVHVLYIFERQRGPQTYRGARDNLSPLFPDRRTCICFSATNFAF